MEVSERKEMTALFDEWKLILEKAGKLAQRLERLIDETSPIDDMGAMFGYCAYCYKENCDHCISSRRMNAEKEESKWK